MEKYIVYLRVSTARQGQSGLGIEAQRSIVQGFIKDGEIIKEFIEVESGTRDNRPVLASALELCKKENATLVIAKLDRLYRNVLFTARLLQSKIKFIACDAPFANDMTIVILSAIAEWEAKRIAERTSGALQELKKRGKKLGTPRNLTDMARAKGVSTRQSKITEDKSRNQTKQVITLLLEQGRTLTEITRALQKTGHRTTDGSPVYREYVARLAREIKSNTNQPNDITRSLKGISRSV